jgi:hypothetical protein
VHQVRHERREPVVVTEADLIGGHRVVLVDDRGDTELQQPGEGAVRVAVVAASGHVVEGQQHLADCVTAPTEAVGVALHEQALAHAGRSLLGGEVTGPTGQRERRQPGGDGAGADQHDLVATGAGRAQRLDERVHAVRVDAPGRRGEGGGADLDHDPAGGAGRTLGNLGGRSGHAQRPSSRESCPRRP